MFYKGSRDFKEFFVRLRCSPRNIFTMGLFNRYMHQRY